MKYFDIIKPYIALKVLNFFYGFLYKRTYSIVKQKKPAFSGRVFYITGCYSVLCSSFKTNYLYFLYKPFHQPLFYNLPVQHQNQTGCKNLSCNLQGLQVQINFRL